MSAELGSALAQMSPEQPKRQELQVQKFKNQMMMDVAQAMSFQKYPNAHVEKVWDKSCSMLGTGLGNATIHVQPQDSYEVGDILTYKGTNNGVIHRATAIKPGYVYLKGDFNSQGDGWVPMKDIKGKVVSAFKLEE